MTPASLNSAAISQFLHRRMRYRERDLQRGSIPVTRPVNRAVLALFYEIKQAVRRIPEQLAPIAGAGKELGGQFNQRSIVLTFGCTQIRPVRSPYAMVERECIDDRANEWPAVREGIRQFGDFRVA